MAKTQTLALNSKDLAPVKNHPLSRSRQRGIVPSAELVPMQFRMPPDFVRAFKRAALDRDMKLNELFNTCFDAFMKAGKQGSR